MSVQMNWLYVGSSALVKSGFGLGNAIDPYNPLFLPPYTMRFKFSDSYDPTTGYNWPDGSWQQVSSSPNVWDYTKVNDVTNWTQVFDCSFHKGFNPLPDSIEVLGANTKGVTNMRYLFYTCRNLVSLAAFDTSAVTDMDYMLYSCASLLEIPMLDTHNVTSMWYSFGNCRSIVNLPSLDVSSCQDGSGMCAYCQNLQAIPSIDTSSMLTMSSMFRGCSSLTEIPLLNTSSVQYVDRMFEDCVNVKHGSYDMYYQMSRQTNPPTSYTYCFRNCGSNTTTGAAELANIPSAWK